MKIKSKIYCSIATMFVASILPVVTNAATVSDGVVKIAVLTDLSGVYSDSNGKSTVLGAQMAIDDFGGTIFGKKIELVVADHQNKPDRASTIARQWFDLDKVDAVFGLGNTAVHLAVANIAKQKNKILFNTEAASSSITGQYCGPLIVHYTYDTYALAKGTVKSLLERGGKNWYIISADYTFGETLKKDITDFVLAGGGKIVGTTKHPINSSDFSSYVLMAQSSKADVVAFANAGADTVNLMKAANEFHLTAKQKVAAMLPTITDIHAMGLEEAQGLNATTGFYWDRTAQTREWSKRFFNKLGKMPNMLSAGTYSAVTTYLNAVKKADTDNPEAVMKVVKSTPINDVFAENGIVREDGRMVHDMYQIEVKSPNESKYPWDYYKIVATIPGDVAFRPMAAGNCPFIKK